MKIRLFLISAAVLIAGACSEHEVPPPQTLHHHPNDQSAASSQKTIAAGRGTLLFFMNPNGGPCQMQDRYLQDASEEIKEYADVVYVKTTDDRSKSMFYQYGVRSLPQIILLDHDQQEIRRFSPGIQQPATIMDVLSSLIK
ncbi:MAG: thioredoxin family protein [FCB group bacterium]|nr:thioredoxin family protein [FCB group bacterium]